MPQTKLPCREMVRKEEGGSFFSDSEPCASFTPVSLQTEASGDSVGTVGGARYGEGGRAPVPLSLTLFIIPESLPKNSSRASCHCPLGSLFSEDPQSCLLSVRG